MAGNPLELLTRPGHGLRQGTLPGARVHYVHYVHYVRYARSVLPASRRRRLLFSGRFVKALQETRKHGARYSGAMIFEPAVRPAPQPSPAAWCLAFVAGQLLLPEDAGDTLAPQTGRELQAAALARHYLGRLDGLDCWVLHLQAVPAGWRAVPLRAAMMGFEPPLSALVGRAAQVLEWDRTHRFCGVCATPTELADAERARRCPACGHTAYPRLSPSMMALVWRDGELLLARSPHFTQGMYSALAGFVEAGESLEDCVLREVHEEVGVQVADLRYYGSQSWPFPHSLMVAYTARWTGGDIVPQPGEIEHAAWFPIDALPKVPPRFSISGHLIRDTVQALAEGRLR